MIDDIPFLDDETRPRAPAIPEATEAHRAHGRRLGLFHRFHLQQMAMVARAITALEQGSGDAHALARDVGNMAMLDNYRRVGSLCGQECQMLTLHHTIEDQEIFPRLRNQSTGLKAVIDRLSQEHEIVHTLLERLEQAALVMVRTPSAQALADLRTVFEALHRVVASHFGYEEEELAEALGYYRIPL
ncbi:MAG: hemerythrin domain-containing protein [Salinarimonas sp.]|nr:hemerythrin domain-containing protein [Salinarimonas sp.]